MSNGNARTGGIISNDKTFSATQSKAPMDFEIIYVEVSSSKHKQKKGQAIQQSKQT